MWISFHVGLEGNKLVDERACYASLNGPVFYRVCRLSGFGNICFTKRLAEKVGRFRHW
jgi:hypothetical protein